MSEPVTGRVSAVQSMGTVDGPGVRFVAFLQGCPLRCACCHNPETWSPAGGEVYTADRLAAQAARYRAYFGKSGGITLSGGEPLLQPAFAAEVFRLCRAQQIHTCLDTSGCGEPTAVETVLEETEYCLLDVKFTNDAQYRAYAGCGLAQPLAFLERLEARRIPTRIRQVMIPGVNDTPQSVDTLRRLTEGFSCVQEWELLPFRTLCREKYARLEIPFRLEGVPDAAADTVAALQKRLPEKRG